MQRPLLFLVFGQRSMVVPRAKRPSCFILRGRSVFFVTHGSTFKISERCRRRWRWSGCHAAALMGSPVRAGYRFQIVSQQQTRIKLDGDGRAPIFSRWCSDMTQRVKFDHPPPVAVAGCLGDPLALWPNRAATVSHVCHEPLPLLVVNSDRGRLPRRVVSGMEPVPSATPVLRGASSAETDSEHRSTPLGRPFLRGGSPRGGRSPCAARFTRHGLPTQPRGVAGTAIAELSAQPAVCPSGAERPDTPHTNFLI
jgi:hypothetical protein